MIKNIALALSFLASGTIIVLGIMGRNAEYSEHTLLIRAEKANAAADVAIERYLKKVHQ